MVKNEFQIRQSQLITPFGIGSLVNVNNQSLMIKDSQFWNFDNCKIFHDIRLEKVMNSNGFIEPPVMDNESYGSESYVPCVNFPQWYFSPTDHQLKRYRAWKELAGTGNENSFKYWPFKKNSKRRRVELIPVRIICVCPKGHVQDFPWIEWVHQNDDPQNDNHELELYSTGYSGGIDDLSVKCTTCNKKRSLRGIFSDKFNKKLEQMHVSCNGKYLWKKDDIGSECKEPLTAILKNASNFYFPNISVSVNIPFENDETIEIIKNDEDFKVVMDKVHKKNLSKSEASEKLDMFLEDIASRVGKSKDKVVDVIFDNILNESESNDISDQIMDYRRAEFEVLSGKRDFDKESGRLNILEYDDHDLKGNGFDYSNIISGVTLVKQLEVVNVLRSFSRIRSTDTDSMKENLETTGDEAEVKEVSLKRVQTDGKYVGMRFLGEGIFISFKKESINKWANKVKNTNIGKNIYNKKVRFEDDRKYLNPSYYMIHTFSHILIKELNNSCGYSSSALKERLYFSESEGEEMYGILIYTSSSDSEGTLGGLVKQGKPDNLSEIIERAIEKAKWCSFDPICIESDSQGRDSLNAAACHACVLISETSCEKMNSFLDRRMLIGNLEYPNSGFFTSLKK